MSNKFKNKLKKKEKKTKWIQIVPAFTAINNNRYNLQAVKQYRTFSSMYVLIGMLKQNKRIENWTKHILLEFNWKTTTTRYS